MRLKTIYIKEYMVNKRIKLALGIFNYIADGGFSCLYTEWKRWEGHCLWFGISIRWRLHNAA